MSYTICSRFKGEHIVYAGCTICTSIEHIVYGAFCGSTGLYSDDFVIINDTLEASFRRRLIRKQAMEKKRLKVMQKRQRS